jgi:hypothetical protein
MMKSRFSLTLNCLLLISLILASCGGAPQLPGFTAPTPTVESSTAAQQTSPPALIETDPPLNSVIGHQSPITFYFDQPMNKPSVESALSGLPEGTFTWNDEATLIFTPTQPYPSNTKLNIVMAASIQSGTGFGVSAPIELSFTVADHLRGTNLLPKANTTDVNVGAAIAISFNQPVVALGADSSSLTSAFNIQPAVSGRGEWINTSTYVFYPESSMQGGTEYTVSVDENLRSVTGVGLDRSVPNAWKFVTSRPRVVTLEPSSEGLLPLDPKIKLTFNQPMDRQSVESNFVFSGAEGAVNGEFAWNVDSTELTFTPGRLLARNIGYRLNLDAVAKSQGGMTLETDYGAVLRTYDNFAVTGTTPNYGSATFTFNSPLIAGDYEDLVTVTPAVDNQVVDVDMDHLNLYLYGDFIPGTDYIIELSAQIKDEWGQSLGDPFVLNYETPPLPPSLSVQPFGSTTVFVRPDEPVLYANAVNIGNADVSVAPLSLQDFFTLQNSYELQQAYVPINASTFSQTFDLPESQMQEVQLNLTQQNNQLLPGLYYIGVSSPQNANITKNVYLAASSQVNLTFKLGATDALVWAVDLPSQTPVPNAPLTIYDDAGNIMASGTTDADGIWQGAVGERDDRLFAMLGAPGNENFALAVSNWSNGLEAWNFGYAQRVQKPHTEIYMYTDRPIYRPGQSIYYRGVVRQAFNGRYEMPPINNVPIILSDGNGTQLATVNAQLSPFGTFNGQFDLPQNALPGYYSFSNPSLEFYLSLQVAEYRKPEIDLTIALSSDEIKPGDPARANVNASYFFGAPAGDVDVHWALYTKPDTFSLPGYQTGLIDDAWLDVFRFSGGDNPAYFGIQIEDGTGQTTPEGILTIDLPAIPETDSPQLLTLEVTSTDETGLPVSTRTEIRAHPEEFYIGLHPDQWVGTAKSDIGFDVYTADWAGEPSGDKALVAEFKQVRWEKETDQAGFPTYTPVYTPVGSSNFATGPDGRARLSFVPPTSGTYMLDVSGGGAHTQTLIWVGGAGTAAWPDLPNQRLELTADKDSYKAGDTANVFIPNPFATNSLALVTVERGLISNAEVVRLSGSGREYSLPITDEDAPNVYVSVTVLGQGNDFRQGLVNIPVTPDAQELRVQVSPNPPEAGPRDNVTFDVAVTDHQGQPVEGEFSLSVVDKSVLALADPNAEDILPAFYSNQPLGVETGLSLAAYSGRNALQPGGLGGGGGQDVPTVREDFPDTAYWNPSLITNSEGRGQVTMTLPDSLTTWQVDVRGLTLDTKVGQAETEIVSTKPLLIRPVTPRFLVSGDHMLMAAVVNNNTSNTLKVAVSIQGDGFVLDQPESTTRNFDISSHSQARVEWWGTAGLADSADLTFSVTTSGPPALQDSARPVWGNLPILQYTAPQAFVTGGVLRGAASQQEVISLPRTFAPGAGGGLDVELSPSLAGSLLSTLEAVDVPESSVSAEASVSYLLPNIEVYRSLKNASLDDPALTARVTMNLNASVSRLSYLQNADGGWSWWGINEKSDPYISAYVFFGLLRARGIGAVVNDDVLSQAVTFLQASQTTIDANTQGAELDEITFIQFALSQAGVTDPAIANSLYDARDRMSPSSLALLAYTLKVINPAETRVRDLISNLESRAIRTASSAHWETPSENILTRGSSIYTTSVVVYILAQLDPANQIVFDAVRYLSAHRNARGLWSIGHENAWAMMALNEAMVGFGDLRSDFAFNATLNGNPLTSGDVAGIQLVPLTAQVPLEFLSPNSPNLLTIHREDGLGRLYYRVVLNVNRPVTDVKPLNNGMSIERVYCKSALSGAAAQTKGCPPLSSLQLTSGQPITAQLTLILPHESYYVMVEDHIPAGMEILNRALKTSQLGVDTTDVQVQFDEEDPFANGWGWWLFNEPQIRDEGILFTADYLPAGTYVLTYTLVPLQAGEYRVLPAHAWQAFFPEVQGTSAGEVFEVKP